MKSRNEIGDNEIRVIGTQPRKTKHWIAGVVALAVIAIVLGFLCFDENGECNSTEVLDPQPIETTIRTQQVDSVALPKYMELKDTTINDIPLRLAIPHNATMQLHIGEISPEDSSVIYAAMAADLRADNGGIVSAFVLRGELKAKGSAKKGYCAIIDNKITIGVAQSSPLFEEAIEKNGYFFRQYPLVDNGKVAENRPQNRAIRRAICSRQDEIFIIETLSRESLHDFAQSLVDMGVENAITLVGGDTYSWAVDSTRTHHYFGNADAFSEPKDLSTPDNRNYIIWR
ncbi:MAG: hypothetical protein SNH27_14370 [Rikenellaceae bacterium]